MTQEQKPAQKCLKCGNEDTFEIMEADWATDEVSNKHYYVETVKCGACGFMHRAKYELVSWEEEKVKEEKVKCQTRK